VSPLPAVMCVTLVRSRCPCMRVRQQILEIRINAWTCGNGSPIAPVSVRCLLLRAGRGWPRSGQSALAKSTSGRTHNAPGDAELVTPVIDHLGAVPLQHLDTPHLEELINLRLAGAPLPQRTKRGRRAAEVR
jgi:hypothetical protein